MRLTLSTNTGGSVSVTFTDTDGNPVDLSSYTIDVEILTDLDGSGVTVADGGMSLDVSGAGDNVLTIVIPDGHGLAAGVYPVQGRYHSGDGNWLDLFKASLTIAAKGGCGGWSVVCASDGQNASAAMVALVAGYTALDGGVADSTYLGSLIDGGSA